MTTVAVTGASGTVGRALLARLDADPAVTRILGVDLVEPQMPPAKLDFRLADVRDRMLWLALEGADAVVHLVDGGGPEVPEDRAYAITVGGTANVLAAAARAGARRVVVRSSAAVYGAHPDNPVPLTEDAPLRAMPDFAWAHHRLLVEEAVERFAREHPRIAVTVLRPAPLLAPDARDWFARHLGWPRLPIVRGHEPPVQVVGADDLAAAAHLALEGGLRGPYNVACDGWLPLHDAARLLRRRTLDVPDAVASTLGRRLWHVGVVPAPPEALPYVQHPWVVSSARLRAHGWAPTRSNRDVLRDHAAATAGWWWVGRHRVRRRDVVLGMFGAVGLAAGAVAGRLVRAER